MYDFARNIGKIVDYLTIGIMSFAVIMFFVTTLKNTGFKSLNEKTRNTTRRRRNSSSQ